jgi:hypothetical protein
MSRQFVGEAIRPVAETSDTSRMALGEPGLPEEFVWRGETVRVAALLRAWRETGACDHGSDEAYVRKHWFEIETARGQRMRIYFERQARGRRQATARWWLFSIEEPGASGDSAPSAPAAGGSTGSPGPR